MSGKAGCSGGARPGSGPKPKEKTRLDVPETKDPLEFLMWVMNDPNVEAQVRVRAAITAARYKRAKLPEAGKKQQQEEAAKSAGSGKFAPAAPPKLVVNNTK